MNSLAHRLDEVFNANTAATAIVKVVHYFVGFILLKVVAQIDHGPSKVFGVETVSVDC